MTWQGCLGSNLGTALAVFGERCGNSADKFRWTGIFAYSTTTGQLYNNCVALRSAETDATKVANMYGSCGVAPAWFPAVPTTVCMETSCECSSRTDRNGLDGLHQTVPAASIRRDCLLLVAC